ncbi:MAG TPA: IS701 family transposase [Phycisphaerae bacterium]
MDADTILLIKPSLTEYLHGFDECFGRVTARRHLDTYVLGQLGDLERKSVEPMADAAGTPPRDLQQFLGLYRWDESAMRDLLQQRVARRHSHSQSVGIVDETSFVKKGDQTACVQRQHCGAVGKAENCVVSVHLGYATPEFHALLDGTLYLPEETWHEHRERCRKAGIPQDVVYRSKWRIALEQLRRARGNGVRFTWMTFDEGYGGKPPFLRELDGLGQNYVAEVPASFHVWTQKPDVLYREAAGRPGRPRNFPRLKKQNNPTVEARNVATYSPLFRRQDWQNYRVKDGTKGPMVWKVKCLTVWLKDENGLPGAPHHLLVAVNGLDEKEVKYFLSNAPEDTPVETLLLVAFSRWKIERMFQDGKGEVGLDHFEVRKYLSIQRHLILSCVSYLFLAEFQECHRGKKSGADAVPDPHRHGETHADLAPRRTLFTRFGPVDPQPVACYPTTCRQSTHESPQADLTPIAGNRPVPERPTQLQLASFVAL